MKTWRPWARMALTLAALAGVASCAANTAYFRPEPGVATTTTRSGHRAAYYVVRIDNNDVGTVSIWSRGAYRVGTQAGSQAVLDVRLSIHNDGTSPLMLAGDRTNVDIFTGGRLSQTIKEVYTKSGSDTVGPGSVAHIRLLYPLPSRLAPGDVDAFDLNWAVLTEGGSFAESTPFVQRYFGYYEYPYYYPYSWYGPYWGWWPYWGGGFYDFDFYFDRGYYERGREFRGGGYRGGGTVHRGR